jgi:hypothetical protein
MSIQSFIGYRVFGRVTVTLWTKAGCATRQYKINPETSKKACNSDRQQLFFNKLDDFSVNVEHITLINLCLNATYSLVWISQIPTDTFLIKMCPNLFFWQVPFPVLTHFQPFDSIL